jgi:hypothetical protein
MVLLDPSVTRQCSPKLTRPSVDIARYTPQCSLKTDSRKAAALVTKNRWSMPDGTGNVAAASGLKHVVHFQSAIPQSTMTLTLAHSNGSHHDCAEALAKLG